MVFFFPAIDWGYTLLMTKRAAKIESVGEEQRRKKWRKGVKNREVEERSEDERKKRFP